MKKILAFVLLAVLMLSVVACGNEPAPVTTTDATTTTDAPTSTEAPTSTDAPTTTEAPKTTEAPTTTAAPVTTEAPVTTAAPLEKKVPGNSKVYVDGTGAKQGAYTSIADAVNALPDDGGTVIIAGDTATPTDVAVSLAAKPITLTSENGAKFTIGRAFKINDDATITNITLVNGAADGLDFIYMQGHSLMVTDSVTTVASEKTGRHLSIFAGEAANANTVANSELLIYGGTWRNMYLGSWSGYFEGTVNVVLDGCKVEGGAFNFTNNNSGMASANCTVTVKSGEFSTFKLLNNQATFAGTAKLVIEGGVIHGMNFPDPEDYEYEVVVDLSKGGTVELDSSITTNYTKIEGNGTLVVK